MIESARIPTRNYVLIALALVAAQAFVLYAMGRVPMCACGTIKLWHGAVQSAENSQHIFDWYSFSHVLHGIAFYGLAWLLLPQAPFGARLAVAIFVESAWEVFENTDFIINRYRTETISLNYYGDSIVNSVSDNVAMIVGFVLAHRLPAWLVIVLAAIVEIGLAWRIRDNLTLNIIILLYPFEAVRNWQAGAGLQ